MPSFKVGKYIYYTALSAPLNLLTALIAFPHLVHLNLAIGPFTFSKLKEDENQVKTLSSNRDTLLNDCTLSMDAPNIQLHLACLLD